MESNLNAGNSAKPQIKLELQDVIRYNSMYNKQFEAPPEHSVKNEKAEAFKTRLESFSRIKTLDEAKNLLNTTMPVSQERTVFYIGDAKCTIYNKRDLLKICFESPTEIVIYNFT